MRTPIRIKKILSDYHFKPKKAAIVILTILAIAALIYLPAHADESPPTQAIVLKVGLYENAPKIYTDADGQAAGFWPDLLRHIAAEEEWELVWVPGTWEEGLDRLEKGEIDIMPDVAWTEARNKRFDFSQETVLLNWSRLYVRKGLEVQTVLDLEGKTIAVLGGSIQSKGMESIQELVREFEVECTIVEFENYQQVFEALENGAVDAGVTNKDFGSLYEGDYDVKRTPIIFQPVRLLFAFPKEAELTPYLIETIDPHMCEFKAENDSAYYQVLEKHIGGKVAETVIETIPGWVRNILLMGAGLLIFLLAVGAVSRIQVNRRTAKLRASEARYRNLLESVPDLIFKFNHRGKFLDYQANREGLLYAHPEGFLEQTVGEILPPEVAAATMENIQVALESGKQQNDEYSLSIEGEQHYFEARYIPNGKSEVTTIIRDITKRVRAEQAETEQKALLEAIYRNAPLVLMVVDTERRVQQVNGFATQFAGRPIEEMLGLRGGEALRCLHALDAPEGCGFGEYCQHCLIRNTVLDTLENGTNHLQIEAPFFFRRMAR